MSIQVLARKWRPHNFETLVGQQHVVKALSNALKQQRLHHAYLFTGTRGTGKTTIARILAKCLNCEAGISATPCEQCTSCQEIAQGRFIDLYEVDAASRTKVEDTRDLLDNVQYAPTRARFKIYLIDEVHMLSGHSFNALLKTLEEPPAHVKFLLATTDPQKLPATVLSRCLQFHMKNLTIEQIASHLQYILEQENIIGEAKALECLGRAANGSMRDALSLLDQSIAYGDNQVTQTSVNAMLGAVDHANLIPLFTSIIQSDAKGLLEAIQHLSEHGADFAQVLEEILSVWHQTALSQAVLGATSSLFEHGDLAQSLAGQLTSEQVQLFYQIGLLGRRDLPLAPTSRSGFEMVMLRMLAFQPINTTLTPSIPIPSAQARTSTARAMPTVAKTTPPNTSGNTTTHHPSPPVTSSSNSDWGQIITQLDLKGPSLIVAQHCALIEQNDRQIILSISPKHAPMLNPNLEKRLNEALTNFFKKDRKLLIRQEGTSEAITPAAQQATIAQAKQSAAEEKLQKDSNVRKIIETFNATILPDSVESAT